MPKVAVWSPPNPLANPDGPDFWLIPANLKYYDINAEFAASKVIDWTQKASIKAGDYVGIYITAPVRALRYLCRVQAADLSNDGYRDHPNIKKLMRIELLDTFDDTAFSAAVLKEHGVTSIRGPRRMSKELKAAVEEKIDK